jgi:hypothetical protein
VIIKSNKDDDVKGSESNDSIFQIMDGIIAQLNRTKKIFIIMILTIMIIPPIAFAVTFALLGPPFHFDAGGRGGPPEKVGSSSSYYNSTYCSNISLSCMAGNRNKAVVRAFKVE